MGPRLYIGTSGWSYDHWQGLFYPADLRVKERLKYYCQFFSTVEINNTFYHLPRESTFTSWAATVPEKFLFAVKASRFITHVKRLKQAEDSLNNFLSRARLLKEHLGPILFQLPPGWSCNQERFKEFVSLLPGDLTCVFEFRNPSWFEQGIYQMMSEAGLAFCIYDMPGIACPKLVTSPLVYIRFHGTSAHYQGRYGLHQLKEWANLIQDYLEQDRAVYIYFNNDAFGYAVENANELIDLLSGGRALRKGGTAHRRHL